VPVTVDQHRLHTELRDRIRLHRPDLVAGRRMARASDLFAVQRELDGEPPETTTVVVAVVRRCDLADLIAGAAGFAAGLSTQEAADWRRAFTRTVFLAGNPVNLSRRYDFAHVAPGGSIAWTRPALAPSFALLRRLLKAYPAGRAADTAPGPDVVLPGPPVAAPARRELYLATAGMSIVDCLVNVNHLVAEATLSGLIRPGDRIAVRPVPRLVGATVPFHALRADADPLDGGRLRAVAGLTAPI
jgi:hypothetical protein